MASTASSSGPGKLTAAILIVSTTASANPASDASDVALRDVFDSPDGGGGRWDVIETRIVPDVPAQIQRQIMLWTDVLESVNLIVTTGGTGFAVQDNTPEAISTLLHRAAPGLVHAMLAASLSVTPCRLSRRYHGRR